MGTMTGVDRLFFAFDEWLHRLGLVRWWPFRAYCDWWDRRLIGDAQDAP